MIRKNKSKYVNFAQECSQEFMNQLICEFEKRLELSLPELLYSRLEQYLESTSFEDIHINLDYMKSKWPLPYSLNSKLHALIVLTSDDFLPEDISCLEEEYITEEDFYTYAFCLLFLKKRQDFEKLPYDEILYALLPENDVGVFNRYEKTKLKIKDQDMEDILRITRYFEDWNYIKGIYYE